VREPEAHLEALATSEELAEPIQTPLATHGKFAFGSSRVGALRVFQLPELTLASPIDAGADVVWGPRRVGQLVLVATARDELLAIDENAKIVWRHAMPFGPLAGPPAIDDEAILIASLDGHIEKLSLRDGASLATTDVGQPLGTGVASFGKNWLAASANGVVLLIRTPDPESAPAASGAGK
jgi:hypothetical protein